MVRPVELAARRLRPRAGPVGGLALATIAVQIGYPLADGGLRTALTMASVLTFAGACALHARRAYGARGVTCWLAAAAIGLAAEVVGVHTGVPFGGYGYAHGLGPAVAGVPLVVALAWPMMAWPAALVARHLVRSHGARVLVGAWALASWDLFLDPQMVAAGYWRWHDPSPHLPGVAAVPLTNLAGWLVVCMIVSLVLQSCLRASGSGDDRWMHVMYAWVYLSSVLALSAFLHLRAAAAWGALGMGVIAVPPVARRVRT